MARIADIVTLASEMALVNRQAILGRSRVHRVVRIRQACMAVARENGHSLCQIGRVMNRDHSTVSHGIDKAGILAERQRNYASFLDRLRNAAASVSPCIADRLTVPPIMIAGFKSEPEPESEAPPVEADLSDDELLSRAVAAHYAGAPA